MSQVYEGYERQYCELSANLSRKCNSAAALPDGEKKKQEVSELQAGLDDADVLIRKMDLEARSLQPSLKATLLAKLREYKSDLNKLKREVKKLAMPNQPGHEELLESGMAGMHEASANQRDRLAMSTERLNQSTDRLRESRRAALETEELGVSILEDLHQQLEAERNFSYFFPLQLSDVDSAIDKSKKVLTSMSRRISRNKWIVGSIIAALILAIIIVLHACRQPQPPEPGRSPDNVGDLQSRVARETWRAHSLAIQPNKICPSPTSPTKGRFLVLRTTTFPPSLMSTSNGASSQFNAMPL
ncbi:UNVERIFIED_CONTAM: Vesicle transport v-SNARE 12 [Sesamum angustifolium]|uniref:Vesicle transport v-SNARE 12 n=1 Tax=Sesamum angustifolium TaxID=2727405 RepID=A0AAW2IJ84_9LAMI